MFRNCARFIDSLPCDELVQIEQGSADAHPCRRSQWVDALDLEWKDLVNRCRLTVKNLRLTMEIGADAFSIAQRRFSRETQFKGVVYLLVESPGLFAQDARRQSLPTLEEDRIV